MLHKIIQRSSLPDPRSQSRACLVGQSRKRNWILRSSRRMTTRS